MTEATTVDKRLSYLIGDPSKANGRVSLVLNGKWRSFLLSSAQGQELAELLRADPQDIDAIGEKADIALWIAKRSHGRVTVDECDRLRLDGKEVDYGLAGRITKIIEQGVSFVSLANFIERLSRNPDESVAEDLYRFIEKGNLPLDPDGYILAFKRVDNDYWSFHSGVSGKVQYQPGTTPAMAREDCDPNRQRTCSRGLHACSYEYLNFFYNRAGRLVIVKIDPEHVTAIPADHNDQKLRCCQMDVVGEISAEEAKEHFQSVVDTRYPAQQVETIEYITQAFAATGLTPAALKVDPSLMPKLVEAATQITRGQGNPALLEGEFQAAADKAEMPITIELTPEQMDEALGREPHERLRFTAPGDEPETPATVITAGDWAKSGYDAGAAEGKADKENDYPYDIAVEIPAEIADDETSRAAFAKAYVEGYDAAYEAAEVSDAPAEIGED